MQTKSISVATSSAQPSSYAKIMGGINESSAARLILEYCESRGLSASSRIYISVVGRDSLTVSGPPEVLHDFCAQNLDINFAEVTISGLFHASHLYSDLDLESIVGAIGEGSRRKPARLNIFSNFDGQYLDSKNLNDLLKTAVWEILSKQLRWDLITDRVVATLAHAESAEVLILPFASCGVQSLAAAMGRSSNRAVKVVDTTIKQEQESKRGKIAIIGFSGRYPEAESNQEFWDLLIAGLDVHKEIPKDRFDPWLYYDPTGKKKNTSGVTKGCFLKSPGLFDTRFFGLSPREAEQADPAQRLALMTAYEAMEMAGFVPDATASSQRDRVGVFYGTASDDYRECNSGQNVDTYFIPGGSRAFLPARINYHWRFSGPSFNVDTACSSGLAAVHIACNSLWSRDCDTAFAGGTNVLTNPDNWAGLDRGHFLSRTGNCNTFDDGADGYCRAESVVTFILKRLEDAELDGDPIFGTILGAYTNHSAEAVSMTRPHSGAQRAIFSKIMTGAGVNSAEVSYIEMHGTGTQHGDACEMDSVLSVFAPEGSCRAQHQPLYLGSTKANIGHAESASGVSSLVKVLLMMQNSTIPPHVGIKTRINRKFPTDLAQRNVHIAFQPTRWTRPLDKPQRRRVLVNNFGAAGGNSSVLIEDAPVSQAAGQDQRPLHMIAVSARTQSSLKQNIRVLYEHLDDNPDIPIGSLSFTTTARRIHHGFRAAVSGTNMREVCQALKKAEAKEGNTSVANANISIGFCFSGQGSQYLGMGRELLQLPQFRSILMELEDILRVQGFQSILPIIDGSCTTPVEELAPCTLQLSIVCLQMALGKLWKSLGIIPRLVVGHSLGEYAALNIAGVLSDADTVHLVGIRAKLLEEKCSVSTHAMLAVKAPLAEITSLIASHPGLEIACVNGLDDIVVAGTRDDIESFSSCLTRCSIKGTLLKVQFAFHSAQVEPMLESYQHGCRFITFNNPTVSVISPLLGKVVTTASEFGSPAVYLSRHSRETVNFCQAVQSTSASDAISDKMVWIEIGPHPVCLNMIKSTLGPRVRAHSSLRRNVSGWETLISTMNALYEYGAAINWNEYHDGFKKTLLVLRLPAYQWELKNFWIPYMYDWCLTKGDNPALTRPPVAQPSKQFFTASVQTLLEESYSGDESWIVARSDVKHPDLLATLQGHRVNGSPLCPSSVYADIALTLFTRLLENSSLPDKFTLGVEVSNMAVDKTLLLGEEPTQLIEMKACANFSSQSATLSICSISKNGKKGFNHANCTGAFTKKSQWTAEWKRRDFLVKSRIKNLRQSIHDNTDPTVHCLGTGMFYKLFTSIVEYGDSFKGLRDVVVRSSELECTATVRFNTPTGEGDKWLYPPYWIESLGQITGFSLNGNDALDTQSQVFINHGWERMRILKTLSPEMTYRTYVKMHTEDNVTYSGDLYVFDSDDQVVGLYEGVTFNALSRSIFDRVLPRPGATRQTTDKALHAPLPTTRLSPQHSLPVVPELEHSDMVPDVALRVRELVSEEVGIPVSELKDDDDLVDLGVDSLLALTMSDRIREVFGVKVDSVAFLGSISVKDLTQRITGIEIFMSDDSSTPSTPPSMDLDGVVGASTEASITPISSLLDLPGSVVSLKRPTYGTDMSISPSGEQIFHQQHSLSLSTH